MRKNKHVRAFYILSLTMFLLLQTVAAAPATPSSDTGLDARVLITLALVILIIVLFLWEPISIDIIALSIPAILVILGRWTSISAEEAFAGFSNNATITILAMLIISAGIHSNGFVQIMGDAMNRFTGNSYFLQLLFVTTFAGSIAAFVNNTPVVALFIPVVLRLARKTKTYASKLLLPLSYATMLGGTLTVVGTSANLVASGLSAQLIGHPFSMFEFTKLGIIVFIIGITYLLTIGNYLLPKHIDTSQDLTDEYEMKDYLTEVVIGDNSPLSGQTMGDLIKEQDLDIAMVKLIRNGVRLYGPLHSRTIADGDHLVIRALRSDLLKLLKTDGIYILPNAINTKQLIDETSQKQSLVEVVLPYGSYLVSHTLHEVDFLDHYNCVVLAIRRGNQTLHNKMYDIALHSGDILLLLGTNETARMLEQSQNFIVVRQQVNKNYDRKKMFTSITILAGVILTSALGLAPISVSAVLGVVVMVVTGCVDASQIYQAINWKIIFIIAGLLPLGTAMAKTGTADYIASSLLTVAENMSPLIVLGIAYLLTSLLASVIGNNASTVLMLPIAVQAAQQLGANPFAFVLAVTFAASTAFSTPIGYQTNLMVYSSGGYRFKDYFIVGAPLQLLLAVVTPLLISLLWGL